MNLFENKVGRPSNELKNKRKKFTLIVTTLTLIAIISIIGVIKNGGLYSLKGGALNNTYHLYVSTKGNDKNNGESKKNPIKTLKRANEILEKKRPNKDVIIHIEPGKYLNQGVKWTYYRNGKSILFDGGSGEKYPEFNNENSNNIKVPYSNYYSSGDVTDETGKKVYKWFFFSAKRVKTNKESNYEMLNINFKFKHIKVKNYHSAMTIIRGMTNKYISGLTLDDMIFENIGDKYQKNMKICKANNCSEYCSAAAVSLGDLSNFSIKNSKFINVENDKSHKLWSHLHALYIKDNCGIKGTTNKIYNNTFTNVISDPIRFRNNVRNVDVSKNTFKNSGYLAYVSDNFSVKYNSKTSKFEGEKMSRNIWVHGNTFQGGYDNIGKNIYACAIVRSSLTNEKCNQTTLAGTYNPGCYQTTLYLPDGNKKDSYRYSNRNGYTVITKNTSKYFYQKNNFFNCK